MPRLMETPNVSSPNGSNTNNRPSMRHNELLSRKLYASAFTLFNIVRFSGQGFSKVLFPALGRREERKWGHPTPRLGTAVSKNPAQLLRNPAQELKNHCNEVSVVIY